MELEGGVRVTIGEHRRDQPFRVCVHDVGDQHAEVWTNYHDEAMAAFEIALRRLLREARRKR